MSLKVKLLRMLTKRPYGLAKFRVNRTLYSKIIRFDKDNTEWMGGKYWFNKELVTIETSAGRGVDIKAEDGTKKTVYNLKDWAVYEEGFPVVYFDANNAVPLHFIETKLEGLPTPKAIQASLKKEMATYEAEVMRKTRSKLMLGIMMCVILLMIIMGLQIYNVLEMGKIVPKVLEGVAGMIHPAVAGG